MRIAAALVCAVLPISVLSALSVVFQLQVRNVVVTAIELGNSVRLGRRRRRGGAARRRPGCDRRGLPGRLHADERRLHRARAARFAGSVPQLPTALVGLLRQGLPVGIGGLLTLGYGYVDQVIVYEIAGVRDAGLYGAVYRIYERIQFLPAAIMTCSPLFVGARDRTPPASSGCSGPPSTTCY